MERNASVTRHPTLAQPLASRRSVATTFGDFTLRGLKAIARAYAQSAFYYPYWIGAGPLPTPDSGEASQR